MKLETKLKKINSIECKKLRKIKLINFSFKLFPNSLQQLEVKKLISQL